MKQPTALIATLLGSWLHAAAAHDALLAPSAQRLLAELSFSDVAFVARLISIEPTTGHCPGSGIAISYQSATYRIERVMMGTIKTPVVVVGHVLMSGDRQPVSGPKPLAPLMST